VTARATSAILVASAAAAGLAVSCTTPFFIESCTRDEDCPRRGEICFPDGCGDPGEDIVVEVSHNGIAQDVPAADLRPTYDLELQEPPRLEGTITIGGSGSPSPYAGMVTVRAVGESLLLPGVPRLTQPTVPLDLGRYAFSLSTGKFEVVVVPRDITVPPVPAGVRHLAPGEVATLDVAIPSLSSLLQISGKLLKTQALGAIRGMDVQVVDPLNGRALTQKQPVSDTGDFTVLAPPAAVQQGSIRLVASPRDGTQNASSPIVPQKVFTLPTPISGLYVLEMGEFGPTVSVSGVVVGPDGMGVSGATVYMTGTTQGGGTFRTPSTLTTDQGTGTFRLSALPGPIGGPPHTLRVIPPAGSRAGILEAPATVTLQGGSIGTYACPARVPVHGTVTRPDGKAASGVQVQAIPVGPVDGAPAPRVPVMAVTDMGGEFSLALDPGRYRLDLESTDKLPRLSRHVSVHARPRPEGGGWQTVEVPPLTLWNGRTVSGKVTGKVAGSASPAPLANASVRFYRVSSEPGALTTSYLLAEGVTDPEGGYSVVMPTAPILAPDAGAQPDGG
jgi:hypothetical protein